MPVVPFCTPLVVRHEVGEEWCLLDPLVFKGSRDYFVMRRGFKTDFASVPRPARWLFDTGGTNSEPGVLHDAVWRESKRTDKPPRVDAWDADGLFRRALRESGATVLTRSLMWIAVRANAMVAGRFGSSGPRLVVKLAQVTGMAAAGAVSVGVPAVVAFVGRVYYGVIDWLVALLWHPVERSQKKTTNWPWPGAAKPKPRQGADEKRKPLKDPPEKYLLVIENDSPQGHALTALLSPNGDQVVPDEEIAKLVTEELRSAY